jgi:hypothetical protein
MRVEHPSSSAYTPGGPTQQVTFESHAVGVGMTEDHYAWIKARTRDEIKGSHTSSIWLALALATLGIVATLAVTITSATLTAATKGELEVAAWAGLLVTALLIVVHIVMWKGSDKRAAALIKEMDLHCFRVAVPPTEASSRMALGAIGSLDVIRATYGGSQRADVTDIVRTLVQEGRLAFTADNGSLGGDPDPNVPKDLQIDYRLAGSASVNRRSFDEGSRVELP